MANLFRDRSRLAAAGRWLAPSAFAASLGAIAGGLVEGVSADGPLVGLATIGFLAMFVLPILFVVSVIVRALWAAWRPRALGEAIAEDGGGAPALAAWLVVVLLAALGLGWCAFQGIWILSAHTAFKALSVSFLEPIFVVAAGLVLVAVARPAAQVLTWLLRKADARWRRRGWRSLFLPWRIVGALGIGGVAAIELVWRVVVKPKIGPFDTDLFDAPLVGFAAWGLAHAVLAPQPDGYRVQRGWVPAVVLAVAIAVSVSPLPAIKVVGALAVTGIATGACWLALHLAWSIPTRARLMTALGATVLAVVSVATALYTWKARPNQTLAIWGDRPLAGLAIDELFDLDAIRQDLSLEQYMPVERPGAKHPDIVLVTIDTVRADHTPLYGGKADMPVLSKLGKMGAIFDWAFSPSNVTRRSIPSMVIGLQPNRIKGRVVGWALRVDPRHVLLAERLAAGGYDTAGFMCCEGFWGQKFKTGLQRGLQHVEIEQNGRELARRGRVWIEERDQEAAKEGAARKPLFVWMHLLEPHNWTLASGAGKGAEEHAKFYDRSLTVSDGALGELLEAFKNRPPGEAPIVIVTADHGEALFEHGHDFHSTDLYDSQTHVPLVIAGPGTAVKRVSETVSLIDLVPTILDLAGFQPPAGKAIDGASIADLATGKRLSEANKGQAFAAMVKDRSNPGGITMVVRGRWKLIVNDDGKNELYDTHDDPDEKLNLIKKRPELASELQHAIDEYVAAGKDSPFDY